MIWAGKGIKSSKSEEPASLLDIYPTLMNLVGLEKPSYLEGTSLMPLLSGEKSTIGNVAITTYGPNNHSIINRRWHYIQYNDGSEELYDLKEDKKEHRNLAGTSKNEIIKQLQQHLPSTNNSNNSYSELKNTPFFEKYMAN